MSRRWHDSTAGWKHRWQSSHVLVHHISVCWSLYFNWTALHLRVQLTKYMGMGMCMYIYIYMYINTHIFNSELCRIWLVLQLLKRNYCIHWGVSVYAIPQIYPIFIVMILGFRYLWFFICLHMHSNNWCSTLQDPHLLGAGVFKIQKMLFCLPDHSF